MARYKIKTTDDGLNLEHKGYRENNIVLYRNALNAVGLGDYNIISYDPLNDRSRLGIALLNKSNYFFYDDMFKKFKQQPEPFFRWMEKLAKRSDGEAKIWVEIKKDPSDENLLGTEKYLLGLKDLEYHHISKEKLDKKIKTVKVIPNVETIWSYNKDLDGLIEDIKSKLKEKKME